jgi:hypothetical protein
VTLVKGSLSRYLDDLDRSVLVLKNYPLLLLRSVKNQLRADITKITAEASQTPKMGLKATTFFRNSRSCILIPCILTNGGAKPTLDKPVPSIRLS